MLFATDKFILSFGDTAKFTIQYENTTLTNTGKKQAIVEASKDGYTWTQVASIAPNSSLPLKIEALYVRLTTDTTISVMNTKPIPRDTQKSDIAVTINTKALVTKDDLQAYVSKNELNDLVHHPDLSGFVTKSQVQKMIPEIPTPPDISKLASKESVELKADQSAVKELKNLVTTKADKNTVAMIQNDLTNQIIPSIAHLHENKADKTELSALAKQVTQSAATVGTLATQVTGFQSALADRVTKSQAEDANRVLLNAITARATTEQLNALHDEVEKKANQHQVDQLVNKAFHLEQDKANKVELIELTKTIALLESLISGDPKSKLSLVKDIKTDILAMVNPELPALVKQALTDSGTEKTLKQIKAAIAELQKLLDTKANTEHKHNISDVTGLTEALADKSDAGHTHAWAHITGKPSSFIPSDHTHPISKITGLDAALAAKAATKHSHTMDDVTGLKEALNSKSPTNHTHTWESITGKPTTFNPTTHGHSVSDITDLQTQLDSKLAKQEAEATYAKKTELPRPVDLSDYTTKRELATKANTAHSHVVADINGLQTALDNKASKDHTHTVSWNALTDKPANYPPEVHSHDWNSITDKPTTFAPSSHTHAWTQITGVPSASTATQGIVQLNDTLVSTATNQALTAKQGKTLQDGKLDKTGGVLTGTLYVPNSGVKGANDNDTGIEFPQDGTLRAMVNSKERLKINSDAVNLYSVHGQRLALQNDKNLVFYDADNSVIWATNSMLKDIAAKTNKSGDTMTGHLRVEYGNDWVGMTINNKTPNKNVYYDAKIGGVYKGGIQVVSLGNGKYATKLLVTPAGDDTQDRRVAGLTVHAEGLHAHAYGHLHEYFVKTRDNQTIDGNKTFSQGVVTTGANGFRIKNSAKNRSIFWRFDGDVLYLLKTPNGDPDGNYDDARPLEWNVNTNQLLVRGNADTATRLQTPRTIRLTGDVTGSVNFDGSGDVSLETTLTKAVVRDYNSTFNISSVGGFNYNIAISGQVVASPDGRITQYIHVQHFQDIWFPKAEDSVGGYGHETTRTRLLQIPLWTAMPNKILSVSAQAMRSTNANRSAGFSSEAADFQVAWAKRRQGDNKTHAFVDMVRIKSVTAAEIDMFIVVEGY